MNDREPLPPGPDCNDLEAMAAATGWVLRHLQFPLQEQAQLQEEALLHEAIASREAGAVQFSLALVEWALQAGFHSPWLHDNRARALVHLQRWDEACSIWQGLSGDEQMPSVRAAAQQMLAIHDRRTPVQQLLLQGDLQAADGLLDELLQRGQDHTLANWQCWIAALDRAGLTPRLLPLLESRIDSHPSQGLFRLIDGLRALRSPAGLDRLFRLSAELYLAFGWRAEAGPAQLVVLSNLGNWRLVLSERPDLRRPDVAQSLQLDAAVDSGCLLRFELKPGESLSALWLNGHGQQPQCIDLRGQDLLAVTDQLLGLCVAGGTPPAGAPALFDAGLGAGLRQLAAPLRDPRHWSDLVVRQHHFGVCAAAAEITVVIPLYRRWDFILGHVAGFSQDSWFVQQRVRLLYVIDDPRIELEMLGWCRGFLGDEPLDVRVITLRRNSGFALACNCGVQAADTPWVCLLNSDVMPIAAGWLEPLRRNLLLEPEALVAPLLLTDHGKVQHGGMEVQPLGLQGAPVCVHPLKGLDPAQLDQLSPDGQPYSPQLLCGAALMLSRSRFMEVGGFDPVFGRGDFEDLEFCLRWRRLGGRQILVPESRLLHLERQSITLQVDEIGHWRALLNAWQARELCPELDPQLAMGVRR